MVRERLERETAAKRETAADRFERCLREVADFEVKFATGGLAEGTFTGYPSESRTTIDFLPLRLAREARRGSPLLNAPVPGAIQATDHPVPRQPASPLSRGRCRGLPGSPLRECMGAASATSRLVRTSSQRRWRPPRRQEPHVSGPHRGEAAPVPIALSPVLPLNLRSYPSPCFPRGISERGRQIVGFPGA